MSKALLAEIKYLHDINLYIDMLLNLDIVYMLQADANNALHVAVAECFVKREKNHK